MRTTRILTLILMVVLVIGCSKGGKSPVSGNLPDEIYVPGSLDTIPILGYDGVSAVGMLGAFDLALDIKQEKAELTPMRISSEIGDAFTVSGASFFTNEQCLRIKSLAKLDPFGIEVNFQIKHPFPMGSTSQPPSATNRLDLDLFDLALVFYPKSTTPVSFAPLGSAYAEVLENADGYTTELEEVLNQSAALPYKICFENLNNNRFTMGTDWTDFDVIFNEYEGTIYFDVYITMGYGASAKAKERLEPNYYIPEFNRKAAWKVVVTPSKWGQKNTEQELPITVEVYDWNHHSELALNFPDPENPDKIRNYSDISSVEIHIPEMINNPVELVTLNPDAYPVKYTINIANENALEEGFYLGLAKVSDSRSVGSLPAGPDILIHTPNGIELEYMTLPEFATYQVFDVVVLGMQYGWGGMWGDQGPDAGYDIDVDGDGNIYLTGYFSGMVDFDPDPDVDDLHLSDGGMDIFLLKLDKEKNLLWANTWGGILDDIGESVALDKLDENIYVVGSFQDTFDPNPEGGTPTVDWLISNGGTDIFVSKFNTDGTFQWAKSWGGSWPDTSSIWDEGHGVAVHPNTGDVYIVGDVRGACDMDPGSGTFMAPLNGMEKDPFMNILDADGNFVYARAWGAGGRDTGNDIVINPNNDYAYVTGAFSGRCVFDTDDTSHDYGSTGGLDGYINVFNTTHTDNDWKWVVARKMGSPGHDEGFGITYYDGVIFVTGAYSDGCYFNHDSSVTVDTVGTADRDVFLLRYNQNCDQFVGLATWGGTGIWDEGHGLVVDNDVLLVTGVFDEPGEVDFDPSDGEYLRSSNGLTDIFLSSFKASTGVWLHTDVWGGPDNEYGYKSALGSNDVIGSFESIDMDFDPSDSGEDLRSPSGGSDVFFVQLLPAGPDEKEPNNECDDANPIVPPESDGIVQLARDEVDYWSFTSNGSSITTIVLGNVAANRLILEVEDPGCTYVVASPPIPGGAIQIIGPTPLFTVGVEYKIKITVDHTDPYAEERAYILQVNQPL